MSEICGHIAVGKIKEVIYWVPDAGADVMVELKKLVKARKIRAGIITHVQGAFTKARFTGFKYSYADLQIAGTDPWKRVPGSEYEIAGPFEVSGQGLIGETEVEGEPYLHVHATLTIGDKSYVGHLYEGCIVRSYVPISHFSVIIAVLEGIEVKFKMKEEVEKRKYAEIHVKSV